MVGTKQTEVQRRESILAAAEEVARRAGIEAVNARSVAKIAGLSHGLVYFYFESKDGLLRGLLDRIMVLTLDGPAPGFGAELPADVALHAVLKSELEDLVHQRESLFLLFQFYFLRHDAQFRDPINEGLRRYEDAMAPVIDRVAHQAGIPCESLRALVMTMIQGAVVDLIRRPAAFDVEGLLRAVRALVRIGEPTP